MSKDLGGFEKAVRLPITAYDVLGYVFPGAVLLVAAFLFEMWVHRNAPGSSLSTPFATAYEMIGKDIQQKDISFVYALLILFLAMGVAYVVGHLVASISAFLIDRVLLQSGYGYPYGSLLRMRVSPFRRRGAFVRGAFFWLNVYLLARYYCVVDFILQRTQPLSDGVGDAARFAVRFVEFLILATVVLEALRFVMSILSKRSAVGHYVRTIAYLWTRYVFALPYDTCSRPVAYVLNTRSRFSEAFVHEHHRYFTFLFGLRPYEEATNNYWLTYFHVRKCSPRLAAMLDNWFGLYSFCRNVSSALFVVAIYCVVYLHVGEWALIDALSTNALIVLVFIPALYLALSVLMLVRFYYLYVCYYSKAVLRAFVYLARRDSEYLDAIAEEVPMLSR